MLFYLLISFWLSIFPTTITAQDIVAKNKCVEIAASQMQNPFNCTNLLPVIQRLIVSYLPDQWQQDTFQETALAASEIKHITAMCAHPLDDNILFLGKCSPSEIIVWDLKQKKIAKTVKTSLSGLQLLACSSNGKYIAATCDAVIQVFDVESGKQIFEFKNNNPCIEIDGSAYQFVSFSPESGSTLLNVIDNIGEFHQWNILTGKSTRNMPLYFNNFTSGVMLSNNKLFAAGYRNGPIIADITLGAIQKKFYVGVTQKHLCATRDGDFLIGLSRCHALYIWHKQSQPLRTAQAPYAEAIDNTISISPDGNYLATSEFLQKAKLIIWNLSDGLIPVQDFEYKKNIKRIVFSSKCLYLIVLGADGKLSCLSRESELHKIVNSTVGNYQHSSELVRANLERREKDQIFIRELYENKTSDPIYLKSLMHSTDSINTHQEYCRTGDTVLMIAICNFENRAIIDFVLSFDNLNVNATNSRGTTALMYAAAFGDIATVKKLLAKENIDINAQDNLGYTALMNASTNWFFGDGVSVLKLLITKPGIDLLIKDNNGKTAFDLAFNEEKKELIKRAIIAKQEQHLSECVIM